MNLKFDTLYVIKNLKVGQIADCVNYMIVKKNDEQIYFCDSAGNIKENFGRNGKPVLTKNFLGKLWTILPLIKYVSIEEAFKALLDGKEVIKHVGGNKFSSKIVENQGNTALMKLEYSTVDWESAKWEIRE